MAVWLARAEAVDVMKAPKAPKATFERLLKKIGTASKDGVVKKKVEGVLKTMQQSTPEPWGSLGAGSQLGCTIMGVVPAGRQGSPSEADGQAGQTGRARWLQEAFMRRCASR